MFYSRKIILSFSERKKTNLFIQPAYRILPNLSMNLFSSRKRNEVKKNQL